MADQIKYWWDKDNEWFCLLADDGTAKATVSLTPAEAIALGEAALAPLKELRNRRDEAAANGDMGASLVLNDRIRDMKRSAA